ncbi:unnamed protein product [Rhizophagus irregularis]|nr:unnamed protein product [Rhizophagus irregularis]
MSYSSYSIEEINDEKYIRFLDLNLSSIIQSYFPREDLFHNALPAKNLLSILNNLKINYGSYFPDLINWIENQYKDEIKLIRIITEKGFIKFDNLAQLFPIGQHVYAEKDGAIIGEKQLIQVVTHLFVQPNLTQFISGKAYISRTWKKVHKICNSTHSDYEKGIEMDGVKEEELFMCASKLHAYSFTWKEWYRIDVGQLSEITFDDKAFDKLVLDQTRKSLIESLVKFEYSKTDIISNKGDGCTFLLHGPPGVGKTLTAEAISEKLHRPLYIVSIGELGTDAKNLEKELRNIFEMADIWNAIILIDEVDIFLERRNAFEVKRNALVCVFLRLLDYHQGIVFLTTNRVNCLDDAFQTRISIFLEYKELDTKARETLWSTFLEFLDYDNNVNVKKLSEKHQLNGREIKNIVKLARALNKEKNELITTELLEKIINISSKKTLEKSAEETQSEGNKRKSGINDQDNQPNSKKIK